MFKNFIRILSCLHIVGICEAIEKYNNMGVQNPIPLLIKQEVTNFLQGDEYNNVCESFKKSTSRFIEECKQAMNLDGFPEELRETWNKKIELIQDTSKKLSHKEDITEIHNDLVNVTNNGFFTDSKVAIYGTINTNKLDLIIDNFWQHLWQARELTEYFVILNKDRVNPSDIPEMCEELDKSLTYIKKLDIDNQIKEKVEKIEDLIINVLSSYQYMEFGKAKSDKKNKSSIERLFAKNNMLKEIMMLPFDHSN